MSEIAGFQSSEINYFGTTRKFSSKYIGERKSILKIYLGEIPVLLPKSVISEPNKHIKKPEHTPIYTLFFSMIPL